MCGPGKYSENNNGFVVYEEDCIQKEQKHHYMRLNSASNEQSEYVIQHTKRKVS